MSSSCSSCVTSPTRSCSWKCRPSLVAGLTTSTSSGEAEVSGLQNCRQVKVNVFLVFFLYCRIESKDRHDECLPHLETVPEDEGAPAQGGGQLGQHAPGVAPRVARLRHLAVLHNQPHLAHSVWEH